MRTLRQHRCQSRRVSVDPQVVDRQVVDAARKQSKMTTAKDRKSRRVTFRESFSAIALVPRPFISFGRGFTGAARPRSCFRRPSWPAFLLRLAFRGQGCVAKGLCRRSCPGRYGDVLNADAPDQTVLPVRMSEILIHIEFVWLRQVVDPFVILRICCKDRRSVIEINSDVAFRRIEKLRYVLAGKKIVPPPIADAASMVC